MSTPFSETAHPDELVQFIGAWERADRALIFDVIQRVEHAIAGSTSNGALWEPWVALQHVLHQDDCYFTAHRLQQDKVVVARSAQDLAEKIAAIAPDVT